MRPTVILCNKGEETWSCRAAVAAYFQCVPIQTHLHLYQVEIIIPTQSRKAFVYVLLSSFGSS